MKESTIIVEDRASKLREGQILCTFYSAHLKDEVPFSKLCKCYLYLEATSKADTTIAAT